MGRLRAGRKVGNFLRKVWRGAGKVGRFLNNHADQINNAVNTGTRVAHQVANAMGGRGGQNLHNLANGVTRVQGQVNNAANRMRQLRAQSAS